MAFSLEKVVTGPCGMVPVWSSLCPCPAGTPIYGPEWPGARKHCAHQLPPVVWCLGTSWLFVVLWGDANGRYGCVRAELQNAGLDRQGQSSDLKDSPEHAHAREGLPGPQARVFFLPVALGMSCPCDMLVGS